MVVGGFLRGRADTGGTVREFSEGKGGTEVRKGVGVGRDAIVDLEAYLDMSETVG